MLILYPKVAVKGQSFKGEKRWTVPNQALSLAEIVRRYVRHEPLPASKDGVYETRFGDLEKMAKLDIVEQLEKADELKATIAKHLDDEKAKADAEAAAQKAAAEQAEKQRFEEAVEKAAAARMASAGSKSMA